MTPNYFTAPDGADEPTIWERTNGDPAVVVRRAELPGPRADLLWQVLTGVLCADDETVERVAWGLCPSEPPCNDHRNDAREALEALTEVQ